MKRFFVIALMLMTGLVLGCSTDPTEEPPETSAPEVSAIPDQTVEEGVAFATFDLDDYVTDEDHADAELTWAYAGETDLTIAIDADHVVTVTTPDETWLGAETITFTATDPDDLQGSDDATFTVVQLGNPVVTGIPDQTIEIGGSFATFDLDDHVSDSNHSDAELTWEYAGETDLTIAIDADHVVTVTTPGAEWLGSETITFTATDPGALSDSDSGVFTVLANAGAEYFFVLLGERINQIAEDLDVVDDPVLYVSELDFSDLRAGFNGAFGEDPDNPVAHLGLSILDFLEVSYSDDLIDFLTDIQELDDENPVADGHFRINPLRGGLIGRHHQILAEAPLVLIQQTRELPVDLTVPNLQNLIYNVLMPAITSAMTHVEAVLDNEEFSFTIEFEGEIVEIDLGEVYFFAAALRELRAAFGLMIAYDMDLAGPDGTYDWIEEMDDLGGELESYIEYAGNPADGDTLHLDYYYYDEGILLVEMLTHWLRPGSDFLTLLDSPYSGTTMVIQAHGDMIEMLNLMQSGVDYIMAEGGEDPNQDDDIIKIGYLDDLNVEIDPDIDDPNFMQEWETIDDVIAWVSNVLQNPFHLQETIDEGEEDEVVLDIWIDISALFTAPIEDWKTKLPYYEFRDQSEWVEHYVNSEEQTHNPDWEYWVWDYDDHWHWFPNISYIYTTWDETRTEGEPIRFLDGLGGSGIDPEEELIYLPDYTLGGLFPYMTRTAWEELLGYND